jgi:hypothetical protein
MQPTFAPAPSYAPLARLDRFSNAIFRDQDRKRLAWLYDNPVRAEYLRSVSHDLQDFRELLDQEIASGTPAFDSELE